MIFPESLQKGDRIRIVAPAGKVPKEKVLPGIELLQDAGYEVLIGNHVFDRHFQYAGTDQQRASDLQVCFDFPVGHIPKNLSLVLGASYELAVGDTCTLKRIQK